MARSRSASGRSDFFTKAATTTCPAPSGSVMMPTSFSDFPIVPVLCRTSVPAGRIPLSRPSPGAAALHDVQKKLARLLRQSLSLPDLLEKRRHRPRGRGVARVVVERPLRFVRLLVRDGVEKLVVHRGIALRFSRKGRDSPPVGDELESRPVDADPLDPELPHPRRHRFAPARLLEKKVGRGVVAHEEHDLEEVPEGDRKARLVEEVGQEPAPG